MQSNKNKIIITSAGGGKTTSIVKKALNNEGKNILITTYTLENEDQINDCIIEHKGFLPKNITVLTWFSFLLRHGIRPYQNYIVPDTRIKSVDFDSTPPLKVKKEKHVYFVNKAENIYRDRVSDFVCLCNEKSDGLIIRRLKTIFDHIYIDEMQDLSGWDLDLVELLLKSSISITLVGDPRQTTYRTTNAPKNKGKCGINMIKWIHELQEKSICEFKEQVGCYRSNQEICNFADKLYPQLSKTVSKFNVKTEHDGVFKISPKKVPDYLNKYNPVILRWNKKSNTMGFSALNIGISKGRTYNRVLLFPTEPMKKYLRTKKLSLAGDLSKLYVAVTRARHSVAFVVD